MNNNNQYDNGAVDNKIAATPNTPERNEDTATTASRPSSRYIPPHLRNKAPCSTPVVNTKEKSINRGHPRVQKELTCGPDGLLPRDPHKERDLFPSSEFGLSMWAFKDPPKEVPVQTFGDDVPDPIQRFEDVDLGPVITNNIGLSKATITPIQKYAVPIILAGRDLMACAQTGSGKTWAYLFPIISKLSRVNQTAPGTLTNKATPECLILTPVRELTVAIFHEVKKFCYRSHLKARVVYGGAPITDQIKELGSGCDILVATPGRLVDLVDRGKISLSKLKYLCLDEVDRMLDMGFEPQLRHLVEDMPAVGVRQTMLFSARFPRDIQQLAQDLMYDYVHVQVGRVYGGLTYGGNIRTQKIVYADEGDKHDKLVELLGDCFAGLTIVYVSTKRGADELDQYLIAYGFASTRIHGDRSQTEREEALNAFRQGKKSVLVATDVAARGLEFPIASSVINYDLPSNIDDYVYRIGRTGHARPNSTSISIFTERNIDLAKDLVDLLEQGDQEVPDWLREYAAVKRTGSVTGRGRVVRGLSSRGRGGRGGYGVSAAKGYADTHSHLPGEGQNDTYEIRYSNRTSYFGNDRVYGGGYASKYNRSNQDNSW